MWHNKQPNNFLRYAEIHFFRGKYNILFVAICLSIVLHLWDNNAEIQFEENVFSISISIFWKWS